MAATRICTANQSCGTNTNDVVYPRRMRSPAGTSALDGYAEAQRRRLGAAVVDVGLVIVATVLAGLAVRGVGDHRWWMAATSAACLLLAWLVRPRRDPGRWWRGAVGEIATASLLDRLPARKWVVMHDLRVPGSRANIDHLVIGPNGVWVVDTKTTRTKVRAGWRRVRVGSRRLDSGPVRWEGGIVSDRLGFAAHPLIVVHGHGLRRRGGRAGGVRVVPIDGLLRRIRRGRRVLTRGQVAVLAEEAERVFRPAGAGLDPVGAPRA